MTRVATTLAFGLARDGEKKQIKSIEAAAVTSVKRSGDSTLVR
jgi:hypothetical protein